MSTRKTLTREQYQEKFDEQMERFCYIRQEGEQIVQCKEPYPPFWFVSNKGYLFSAYYRDARILDNNPTSNGLKDNDGNYVGRKWHYLYGDNKDVTMHKLIAEHFLECDFETDPNEKVEIHHIKKQKSFSDEEGNLCNSADNLQLLPRKIHTMATYYGSKSDQQIDADTMEKAKNVPHYELTEEQMIRFVMQAMQQAIDAGETALVFESNGADDPDNREVKVKKITSAPTLEP